MKIAASDYDGTLFRNGTISNETVEGVRLWRAAGNKFGMVSGRDYGMLKPQLKHYGVEYDFTICNNGGIIRDASDNVIYQKNIDARILEAMSREPLVRRSFHFAFSSEDVTYLCHEREGSWITREAKQWEFPTVKIEESEIATLERIQQFSLGFETPEQANACADVLNKNFSTNVRAYPNRCSVDITPAGVSKRQGLEELMKAMHWEDCKLCVIGDETNDLPMIKAFNGYTVETARAEIKSEAAGVFSDVGSMLKHFLSFRAVRPRPLGLGI